MSIVGLGGTGKTQVALQFAYIVRERWPEFSIFWVPALSMESFEQACVEIARLLSIPQAIDGNDDAKEQFRQHLGTARAGKWLLVVDNADDADVLFGNRHSKGVLSYLPQSEEGVVLFTTRTREVAVSLTGRNVLELGPMNRRDAGDFLEKLLIRRDLLCNGAIRDTLLDELTHLPLAIAQAAAYLNKNTVSIAKYLQLLRSTEQDLVDLMSRAFRDDTRYNDSANSVAATWVVSFNDIRARDAVAADLLLFMSCIEWKAIPHSMLPSVQSKVRMADAISTLCGYSFLVRRGDEDEYDIHRLVHLATRIWVRQHGNTRRVVRKGIQHMADVFPSHNYANRAVWRAYLPHALQILEDKQGCEVKERSELCLLVGQCLHVDGRILEAVRWLKESYKRRKTLDKGNPDRLLSQKELAKAYRANGQIKEAVKLLERVVAIHAKMLAEDHPSRLASQHDLAVVYQANGQIKEAVKLLERVVAIHAEVLAEDHPDRLASQHELAVVYQANGQIKEAVKLLEGIVAIRAEVLAEDHPDQLASQHEFARAYRANGQIKEAVKLLERVVVIQAEVLAEDHPDQLASQHELAGAYQANGQIKEAVKLLERVVAIQAEVLTEDHPDQLASQHGLAIAYRANGQIKEAVKLLERVVAIHVEVLIEDHPSRLASQHDLARAYQANGQIKEAVKLLERVVAIQAEVLAEDHPSRLASQHQLARAYRAMDGSRR
jgi:tetratricopeptide (TPR) repeat protein